MKILIVGLLVLGAFGSAVYAQEKSQEGGRKVWAVFEWIPYVRIRDSEVNDMCRKIQLKAGLSGKNDVIVFEPLIVEQGNLVSLKWTLIPGIGLPHVIVDGEEFSAILGRIKFTDRLKIKQGLCYPDDSGKSPLHAELTTDSLAEAKELAEALQ